MKSGGKNVNGDGALLTNLSKGCNCIYHDLLIAKLEAHGFDKKPLSLTYNY